MPTLKKPVHVLGRNLSFREAAPSDAQFILELRTNEEKGRYLSATPTDLAVQRAWLERYEADDSQVYFVVESAEGRDVGTVRLYDARGDSFCWGSWIIAEGSPSNFAIESALMVYAFGRALGFQRAHFDVRKENRSVWKFHERFGAVRVGESADDYFYEIDRDAITGSIERFERFLPGGVQIEWTSAGGGASTQ